MPTFACPNTKCDYPNNENCSVCKNPTFKKLFDSAIEPIIDPDILKTKYLINYTADFLADDGVFTHFVMAINESDARDQFAIMFNDHYSIKSIKPYVR